MYFSLHSIPSTYLTVLALGFAIVFSLIVLSRPAKPPGVTLAWILAFFLVPFLGILAYLFVGYQNFRRRRRVKPSPGPGIPRMHESHTGEMRHALIGQPKLAQLARLGESLTDFAVVPGNKVEVFEGAHEIYNAIAESIVQAKRHVHMQYYIFKNDDTGIFFRDLLVAKAREGVECRLLVDHIGSFGLNKKFLQPMLDAGVKFAFFWPVRITRPWGWHLRNHRKLVLVDGKVGFLGSQNIGNEYTTWRNRRVSWRDSQVKVTGPAVHQMQGIFLEDWKFTTGEVLEGETYFPDIAIEGPSPMQVLPTGPDEDRTAFEKILMYLIHSAEKRITMVTPYLIPSLPLSLSLEAAVNRGVRVQMLVPRKTDHWIVTAAAQAWYAHLLDGGIEIFEYPRTFLHAKVVTLDEEATLMGSANMDERSFKLNFECSVMIYDKNTTGFLLNSFEKMAGESKKLRTEDWVKYSFFRGVQNGLLRILSPLL